MLAWWLSDEAFEEAHQQRHQALAQHFTPPAVARLMARKAMECMPSAQLFLEPTAGDGAIYYCLPEERRLGVELDSSLASQHGFVCSDILDFRSHSLPRGVEASRVCVVGNPPFTDRSLYKGNRRASGRVWLADLLAHLATLCSKAVLLLPSTVFGRSWFEQSPHMRLEEHADLGKVCFAHLKGQSIHVHVCVLHSLQQHRQNSPTTHHHLHMEVMRRSIEQALQRHIEVLEAGDERANCAVVRWSSPSKIGEVITHRERLLKMRAKLSERQRKRRASATALFLRVRTTPSLWRLEDMRREWKARFASTRNTSVSFSLADFIKAI